MKGSNKPVALPPPIAALVGARRLSPVQVINRLWAYVRRNHLVENDSMVRVGDDPKLAAIFEDRRVVAFSEIADLVGAFIEHRAAQ